MLRAVGGARVAMGEWEDPDLTHASAASLQTNLEKERHKMEAVQITLDSYLRNPTHCPSFYYFIMTLPSCYDTAYVTSPFSYLQKFPNLLRSWSISLE